MEYTDQLKQWFEKYEKLNLKFEDLKDKPHECKQVAAIVFLASKLKNKKERYFLHGEHDCVYIGNSFDVFHEFTEEDVKIAVYCGLEIDRQSEDSFIMYASM